MTHIYQIHNDMYDLSSFISVHPGGDDMFNNLKSGSDITSFVYTYHKNANKLLEIIPKYKRGTVENNKYNYNYDKYVELKKLVYAEMHDKNISFYWSNLEIAYNCLLGIAYVSSYIYLCLYPDSITLLKMILFTLFGMGYGGLILHETSHYTGFKNQKINVFLSNVIHSQFMSNKEWKYQHNYLHHNFTNTDKDCDFKRASNDLLRHDYKHPHHFYNSFQYLYWFPLFLFAGIALGPLRSLKYKRWNALWALFFWYFIGFKNVVMLYAFNGLVFSFIAQLSHIQHECIQINKEKKNDFLYNQVSSAINYRTDNPISRYICFSLDIQIEHHLFPNIPHSSLRQIQPIVKSYCDKNGIPYVEYPNMYVAIINYIKYLYGMS